MSDRRRMVVVDQNTGAFITNEALRIPSKTNRPVSWHPSSQLGAQAPVYPSACPMPFPANNNFHIFDLPPTPADYSGYASPASTFSPVAMPFTDYNDQQNLYRDSNMPYIPDTHYTQYQQVDGREMSNYLSPENTDLSMYSHFDWSNFATNGFEKSTAPPTPEMFLPIQHPDPIFPKEEAIPYHPLSDDPPEEDGEILCGMGLYDNPALENTSAFDSKLDTYRSSMMSQLLGLTHQREASGQGLKLEETWNPPASDDEEDDEDEDGEADDEDYEITTDNKSQVMINDDPHAMNRDERGASNIPWTISSSHENHDNDRISWL